MNENAETVSDSRPSSGSDTGYRVLLVLAVIVAYGPIVLVNQVFWDDWVVLAYGKLGTLWDLYKEMGGREMYPVVKAFVTIADPRFWTTTELLLFCALAPLIHTIIRRVTDWPAQDAFWAALLTALVPLNQARFCPDHGDLRLLLRPLRIVDRAAAARLEGVVDRTTGARRRAHDDVIHDAIVARPGMVRADGGGDRCVAKG